MFELGISIDRKTEMGIAGAAQLNLFAASDKNFHELLTGTSKRESGRNLRRFSWGWFIEPFTEIISSEIDSYCIPQKWN